MSFREVPPLLRIFACFTEIRDDFFGTPDSKLGSIAIRLIDMAALDANAHGRVFNKQFVIEFLQTNEVSEQTLDYVARLADHTKGLESNGTVACLPWS